MDYFKFKDVVRTLFKIIFTRVIIILTVIILISLNYYHSHDYFNNIIITIFTFFCFFIPWMVKRNPLLLSLTIHNTTMDNFMKYIKDNNNGD